MNSNPNLTPDGRTPRAGSIARAIEDNREELLAIQRYGALWRWVRDQGWDSGIAFATFKREIKARLGVDYEAMRAKQAWSS